MDNTVTFDMSEITRFLARLGAAGAAFKPEIKKFLEGLGYELVRIVADEIIEREVVDTRLLLNSFTPGKEGNVWEWSDGGLTIEVGTNVEYAAAVNNGHYLNKPGQLARWVPGRWEGDHFTYDPRAKTGMLLKQQWIDGAHFWEYAVKALEEMAPRFLQAKLDEWLKTYFKDFM